MPYQAERAVAARILICEDEAIIAEDLAGALRGLGYEVPDIISSGDETVRAAEELKPDLILMDIKLHGHVSAIEAVEAIRARMDVPVVYLSAYVEKDVLERAKLTEPYGFLSKPVGMEELRSAVEVALYKHKADRLVRESEERFQTFAENLDLAVCEVSLQGKLLYANPAMARMARYEDVQEVLDAPAADFWADHADRKRFVSRLLEHGRVKGYETLGRRKDGSVHWIRLNSVLRYDDSGKPASHFTTVEDITDQKRSEQALRESEERYRGLVEQSMDGVAVVKGTTLRFVNPAMVQMLGYESANGLVGKPFLELVAPEFREVMEKRGFDREKGETVSEFYEFMALKRDGTHFPAELRVSLIVYEGEMARQGIIRDITDRKKAEDALRESEEAYRSLFENSLDGVVLTDDEGNVLQVNRAACEMTGLTEKEFKEAGRAGIVDFTDPRVPSLLEERKRTGRVRGEVNHKRKDGSVFPAEISLAAFSNAHGDSRDTVIIRDITERKKVEEQLMASLNEKEALLREVHHRVKNNLAVINSLINLQKRYVTNGGQAELFQDIGERIRSMAMAHELLYQSDNLAEVRVSEYIRRLIGHLRASSSKITAPISFHQEVDDVSFGMETMIPLGLVITELVTNCIKHAFPFERGGEVRISLRSLGRNEFELAVADSGVGLPEGFCLHDIRSLGLDLVRILSKQLGGSLEVGGSRGTEVRVRFRENRR